MLSTCQARLMRSAGTGPVSVNVGSTSYTHPPGAFAASARSRSENGGSTTGSSTSGAGAAGKRTSGSSTSGAGAAGKRTSGSSVSLGTQGSFSTPYGS